MSRADDVGLTSEDHRKLARMATDGARPFARRSTATTTDDASDPDDHTPSTQRPVRNPPARHRALAEELRHRDGVEAAYPTADGVALRLVPGASLPPWVRDKAALDNLELRTAHGRLTTPDGEECRRRRERAGLTQRELAERLGVGPSVVKDVEQGAKPVTAVRAAAWREACDGGGSDAD